MAERARHRVERVFPEGVRVRQWVLSLPFAHALACRPAAPLQAAIACRDRRIAREAGPMSVRTFLTRLAALVPRPRAPPS